MTKTQQAEDFTVKLFLLPFRLAWDVVVIAVAIWLEVIWLGFLFGSVVGVVIVLIFAPSIFVSPLCLLGFVINPWVSDDPAAEESS
ncbi:MAG: hypothetical protein ACREYF_11505 [Gammaproteobacteria bacterium]